MDKNQPRAALPRHVEEAVAQVCAMHRDHHSEARRSEKITDTVVSIIGTPTFLGIMLSTALIWMLANSIAGRAFDAPPFAILEMSCSLISVLLAVLILAAQRRDDRLATRREQMALQAITNRITVQPAMTALCR